MADISVFSEPVEGLSPPCTGCGVTSQAITTRDGKTWWVALGTDPNTGLWWCNGCFGLSRESR